MIILNSKQKRGFVLHEAKGFHSGFVILFALMISSVILAIAIGVSSIAFKQINFSTSSRSTTDAIFAADTAVECALYHDQDSINAFPISGGPGAVSCANGGVSGSGDGITASYSFTVLGLGITGNSCARVIVNKDNSSGTVETSITSRGYNISTPSCGASTNSLVERELLVTYGSSGSSDIIWVGDSPPLGASLFADGGDSWTWINSNPTPFSGTLSHQSNINSGEHQHYFTGATDQLTIEVGDTLISYVYLDPLNIPTQVMLQWNSNLDGWNHRAYWGANQICFGGCGESQANHYMDVLPPTGQWVRLEVPANVVGLEGHTLNGMAFTLYNGRATWDHAGKSQ